MTSVALDNGLAAAFQSEVWLIKIVWPTGTMRLMTSPGSLTFGGETYLGGDDTAWGVIMDAEGVQEGIGAPAATCRVTGALTPTLQTAAVHPDYQTSRVDIWRGLRSLTDATLIDAEPLIVNGRVSSVALRWGAEVAEILCVSHSERRFLPSGGLTYDQTRFDAADLFDQFAAGTSAVSPTPSIPTIVGPGGTGSITGGFGSGNTGGGFNDFGDQFAER